MAGANYDIIWSAPMSVASGAGSAGTVLTIAVDGSSYLPATTANLVGSSVPSGVARADWSAGGTVAIQQSGTVTNDITGLGAGAKSPVIVDPTTARMVRSASPVAGVDVVVGLANERGDVTLGIAGVSTGGGGSTIPTPSLTNAVVQVSTLGVITSAPLRVDQLLPAWDISTFAIAQTSPVEVGTSFATPSFTASYVSAPTSVVLTDNAGTASRDVSGTPTSFTSLGTFSKTTNGASVTWTLTAHDATSPTKTRTASVTWLPRLRYGTGAPGLRNAAAILALASSPLASSRAGSFPYAAGNTAANLKCYFSIPSAYGTPTFKSSGLPFAISLVASAVSVTSNGVTQTYDLYESDNVGLGTFTMDVT